MSTRNASWPCGDSSGRNSRVGAAGAQAVGDLLLLLQGEQDVGVHADGQRRSTSDLREAVVGTARRPLGRVLAQVEPVHASG